MNENGMNTSAAENTAGSAKKTVLISFVGRSDPYSFIKKDKYKDAKGLRRFAGKLAGLVGSRYETVRYDGPVLTIARELKPDLLFMFPSSRARAESEDKQTESYAETIAGDIASDDNAPVCHILPLDTDNVSDTEKCYKAFKNEFIHMMEIIERDVPGGADACEFIACCSPGTQQMNQAGRMYILGSDIGSRVKFFRTIAPKDAKLNTPRIAPDRQKAAEEMSLLSAVNRNMNRYQFHVLADLCELLGDISILSERCAFAKALKDIFKAYELMDMLCYEDAWGNINNINAAFNCSKEGLMSRLPHLQAESISDVLHKQLAFLDKVRYAANSENAHNLVDIFFNMNRAIIRGNYADALARFWRLREGVMYFRLACNGVNVRDLDTENDNVKWLRSLDTYADKFKFDKETNKYLFNSSMSMQNYEKLLTEIFDDGDMQAFVMKHGKNLELLRKERNQTLVAHGMMPVNETDATMCRNIGAEMIDLIPGGRDIHDSYPFTLDHIRVLTDMLKA